MTGETHYITLWTFGYSVLNLSRYLNLAPTKNMLLIIQYNR